MRDAVPYTIDRLLSGVAGAVLGLCCLAGPAHAEVDLAANAGALEVFEPTTPQHVGAYSYLALSLAIPTDRATLVPSLGAEWSPELGAWGFVASLTADFPAGTRLGIDVTASLAHDQLGSQWADATYAAGIGGGVSVFLGPWTVSPSINVFTGLNVSGWTIVPTINLSHSL